MIKNNYNTRMTPKIKNLLRAIFETFVLKRSRSSEWVLNLLDEKKYKYYIPSEEIIKKYNLPNDSQLNIGYHYSEFFIAIDSEEDKKNPMIYWFKDDEKFIKELLKIAKEFDAINQLDRFLSDERFEDFEFSSKIKISLKDIIISEPYWGRHVPIKLIFTKGYEFICDPYAEHLAKLEYLILKFLKQPKKLFDINEKSIEKLFSIFKKLRLFLHMKKYGKIVKDFASSRSDLRLLISLLQPKNEKELFFLSDLKIADSSNDVYGAFPYVYGTEYSNEYIEFAGSTDALKTTRNKVYSFKFPVSLTIKQFEHRILRTEDFDEMFELMLKSQNAIRSYVKWYKNTYGQYGLGYVPAND